MKKIMYSYDYESPDCETIIFELENAVLASSGEQDGSLGSMGDNFVGEDFI